MKASSTYSPRQIVKDVLSGKEPPYTPWSFRFTEEPKAALCHHYGCTPDELIAHTGCHILELGSDIGFFEDLGNDQFRDVFGVVWDRSQDKDIGMPANTLLEEPEDLESYVFPDPLDPRFFEDIERRTQRFPDRFRLFTLGFSLYERAWTLRGTENLLMDFIEDPDFVHELFTKIADYNIAQVKEALKYDIDAVYYGDDWGQQSGLIMGYYRWKEFIYPQLQRMYGVVKDAGKFQFIHSCGDVDELFDDLIGIGLDCFNPFQPEVMDTYGLHEAYLGRLGFWGGLSTQSTLPYKGVEDVREESRKLISMGRRGGYIFSPSHSVESDVPMENIFAFIEEAKNQQKS
ncbi:MAG: uroporphyrinogen decarboxylase family protein [Puniceicoccaceae bacterium]